MSIEMSQTEMQRTEEWAKKKQNVQEKCLWTT